MTNADDDGVARTPEPPQHRDQAGGPGLPPAYPPAQSSLPAQTYPTAQMPTFDTPLSAPVSSQPLSDGAHRVGPGAHSPGSGGPGATATDGRGARTPSRRRAAPVVAVVLGVLLVVAVGAGAYLAVLSNQWHERSGQWESESRMLGEKVANLTTDLSGMTAELTITREQLATAQTRITELADEKAQVGDDRENQKLLASDIQAVAQEALDVSASLGDCIAAQNTVLTYLTTPDSATPEVMQAAVDQSNSVCTAAIADHNALLQDLADQ